MMDWTRMAQTIAQYEILAALKRQLNQAYFEVRVDDGDVFVIDRDGVAAVAYIDSMGDLRLEELKRSADD